MASETRSALGKIILQRHKVIVHIHFFIGIMEKIINIFSIYYLSLNSILHA